MDTGDNSENRRKTLEMPDIKICLPLQGAQQPNTSTDMYLP